MPKSNQTAAKVLDGLRQHNVELSEAKAELASTIDRLEHRIEHQKRETANVSRVFVALYEDKRTLDLRMGWLEEAASDVVNSCPKHLPGLIVKLADELGIEITGD